jgi:iron complex transport system ATP-binding protein
MAEPQALVARGLTVALSGKPLIEGVDFEADFGSVLAVLGPNGAGKTTLLRALAGLLAHRGRIELCGRELARLSPRELGRALAFVPQRSLLMARLPVYSVVSHGRYAHRGGLAQLSAHDRQAIETAMARADVLGLASRELPELSHGEQRRVLLARALATEARVLLLDEPSASLDIAHSLSLFSMLRALAADGYCVVLVVHQLDDALRFTDRSLLLSRGQTIAFGPTPEVVTPEHVRSVYGVELVQGGALGFRLVDAPVEAKA